MSNDINQELVSEIRRMNRNQQISMWIVAIFLAATIPFLMLLRQDRQRAWQAHNTTGARTSAAAEAPESVWSAVEAALDRGDNQAALATARRFVERQPQYHYAHANLGSVYIAVGDFTNAEAAYARAVELYPHEDNEKALAAIRKRLGR